MPKIVPKETAEKVALQLARVIYGLGLELKLPKEVRKWVTFQRITDKQDKGLTWSRISFAKSLKKKSKKTRARKQKKRLAAPRSKKVFIQAEPKQATEGLQKALLARAKALRPSSV